MENPARIDSSRVFHVEGSGSNKLFNIIPIMETRASFSEIWEID